MEAFPQAEMWLQQWPTSDMCPCGMMGKWGNCTFSSLMADTSLRSLLCSEKAHSLTHVNVVPWVLNSSIPQGTSR